MKQYDLLLSLACIFFGTSIHRPFPESPVLYFFGIVCMPGLYDLERALRRGGNLSEGCIVDNRDSLHILNADMMNIVAASYVYLVLCNTFILFQNL